MTVINVIRAVDSVALTTNESYNPVTNAWSAAGTRGSPGTGLLGHTSTLLAQGDVLVAGGGYCVENPLFGNRCYINEEAWVYQVDAGSWQYVPQTSAMKQSSFST